MSSPKALVLTGYGINTDQEVFLGLKLAGAEADRVHLKDLIKDKNSLDSYHLLVLPGGFSFGDDIAAGKILAKKLVVNLRQELSEFINRGKLILGICNGFQVLVKMGLLPESTFGQQKSTLTTNISGKFEDRWVYLSVNQDSPCIFTKGIDKLYLPVRNGEGKFLASFGVLDELVVNDQIPLTYVDEWGNRASYPYDPSGSMANIAGICDRRGRIFGLMPHPEAYLYRFNHPRWTREKLAKHGQGLQIFENAVDFIKKELL